MSKRRSIKLAVNNGAKVAEVDKEGKEDDDEKEIDWNLCFICQTPIIIRCLMNQWESSL